ncbi:dihydrolipoamide acetyltransferase family protein [Cupriavidus basilensis]|uniref:Dihydrolipoamide acetyltransferase component of pyruvate dehydrogenase complex n=1 Tax=Cupriavidus basilensis TaxID=68895 RepID=A0A0C4YFP6_9BURK|nr:dihydrolipoamide acetyltransferase family protein [Cupriavidus basilensis]AJG19541.1 Dihydrolipoamide acetyltransferase component (E2) of acetoin dehydrogenase complex [Cupriavidus basilensis]
MIEFRLPALGADMDEGTLLEWTVKPGDPLKRGQVVAVVDTSKAAVEVECWHEGTVAELIVTPGAKIPVGTLMAVFLEPGETPGAARPATGPADAPAPSAAHGLPGIAMAPPTRHMVSPAARKSALELGIDIDAVFATDPNGIVKLADVERAVRERAAAPVDKSAGIRKAIAVAMARSKREIPHYYVGETIPLGATLAWLTRENANRPMAERLLPAALLIKAVAVTLKNYPELNGFFRDEVFHAVSQVHVGVAISLRQGGLIAPALLDADTKPLTLLMRELSDLVKRCRAGSLRSSEMAMPTITVTNLGDQGAEAVFGVIYPPQVALVGIGRVIERPWAENGELKVVPAVTASLSADHRVSDGHRGALFLVELRELLQHPEELNQ